MVLFFFFVDMVFFVDKVVIFFVFFLILFYGVGGSFLIVCLICINVFLLKCFDIVCSLVDCMF